jgi:CheY-like chemotaxis protein
MTIKETSDALLHFLEIVTAWPIILLFIFILFRREIRTFLPELVKRIEKATIKPSGEVTIELQKAAIAALPEVIKRGVEEYRNEPERLIGYVDELFKKLPKFQVGTVSNTEPNLSGYSVLWVDDNPMNNFYETSILNRLGAGVVPADSTKGALQLLSGRTFDLIISDMGRVEDGQSHPEAGYELLQNLSDKRCPVIFYTTKSGLKRVHGKTLSVYGMTNNPRELIDMVTRALTG